MERTSALKSIPDDELLRRLAELLRQSRRAEADLVAHIGEVDERRLYAREASPSMFAYCTEVLHLSEAEAYLRIAAARASREHPVLLEMLADGRLHLTGIAKLAPHLTPANREALLQQATHKSKREIKELVAAIVPRPDVPALMRRLPERRAGVRHTLGPRADAVAPGPGPVRNGVAPVLELRPDGVASGRPEDAASANPGASVIETLAPARYKVQFTASAALHDKLERLRALMRASVPDGDLAEIIELAVSEKLERLEARRFGRTRAKGKVRPAANTPALEGGPATRHIPAAVKRAVYERDGGRCRYVDGQGRRCTARDGLEFHHRHPFGFGGDHSVDGLCLLCRAHNRYLAEVDYGRARMAAQRRSPSRRFDSATSPLEPAAASSP